tara:strand:+ start:2149 stop:5670 length:3522 start_codon:yes stop_codon:yes gene_type:complete
VGQIKINTQQGPILVNIKGDEPTEAETKLILQEVRKLPKEQMSSATPEREDISKFYSTKLGLGGDGGQKDIDFYREKLGLSGDGATSSSETDPLKDPEVDYLSGLKNFRIRAGLANKEKPEEKAAYLEEQVGADGFRKDKGGRFILTQKGREKLGLPEGPDLAIDEEGASRYDVADFLGETAVPLSVGIAASIKTAGMRTLPGMAIVGGTMAVGKILDEAFEYAQGYQRQTALEVGKDAAWEGVFGAGGEGLGRLLSRAFGRIFKGSASKEAEEAKTIGRAMRESNFKPSVEGAAPGAFGIVTRLQAIYEGISPNKKAASENVDALIAKLKGLLGTELKGTSEEAIDNLGKTIQDDVQKLYSSFDEILANSEKALEGQVSKEIENILKPLKEMDTISTDTVKGLTEAKTIFNKNIDSLYKKVDQALGRNNEIIPLGRVMDTIDEVLAPIPKQQKRDLGANSDFNKLLLRIRKRAEKRLQSKVLVGEDGSAIKVPESAVRREMFARPEEAFLLQKMLSAIDFANGPPAFAKIKTAVDDSFDAADDLMDVLLSRARQTNAGNIDPKVLENMDFTGRFGGDPVSMKELSEGLKLFRATRQHYAKGLEKFKDVALENIVRSTRSGRLELDPIAILNKVIRKDQPKFLNRLLSSRRGVSFAISELDPDPKTVRIFDTDVSIPEAKEVLRTAETNNTLTKSGIRKLRRKIKDAEAEETAELVERSKGGLQGEELRQALASAFIRDALTKSTKDGVVDGVTFARLIDDIGTTKDVLFKSRVSTGLKVTQEASDILEQVKGGAMFSTITQNLRRVLGENGIEVTSDMTPQIAISRLKALSDAEITPVNQLKEINELITLLRSKATKMDESVLNKFAEKPLAQAIKSAKKASLDIDAINKQTYLKNLRGKDASKIVDTIFTKDGSQAIKAFMNNSVEARVPNSTKRIQVNPFDDETHKEVVEKVKDAAMGKLLKSVGDVESSMFQDDFLSGKLGGRFKTTLEGYGRESLHAMFGKEQTNKLFELSEMMIRASDKPLAGKGGLAAPTIALGLSIFGLMTAPFYTLGALAFYSGMSKLLRSGPVLDIMLASRKPGADKLGQALQSFQTVLAQVEAQAVTSDEGPLKISPEAQKSTQQMMAPVRSAIPNVAPAFTGTSAANVDPTNPIVNPDPASQALAQALASR